MRPFSLAGERRYMQDIREENKRVSIVPSFVPQASVVWPAHKLPDPPIRPGPRHSYAHQKVAAGQLRGIVLCLH